MICKASKEMTNKLFVVSNMRDEKDGILSSLISEETAKDNSDFKLSCF
jgi:hypothetical protein